MKSNLNLFLVAAFTLVAAACSSGSSDWDDMMDNQSGGSTASGGSSSSSSTPTTAGDLTTFDIAVDSTALTETETVPSDNEDYIENNTFSSVINIKYSGTSATVSGSADGVTVTTNGANVSVASTAKNVAYVLSGSTSNGSFKVQSSDKKFEIKLNGVSITNPTGAAINSQSGKRAYIVVADGTSNYLTDGTSYTIPDKEDMKGTIFSEGELLFSGSGKLRISANAKAGISSDDYVMFRPGNNIYVKASAGNAIKGNDAIIIKGGVINVETSAAASKGISSDGYVEMDGGRVTAITTGTGEYDSDEKDVSGCSGVKSDSTFTMNGGELLCKSTGKGGKGISSDQQMIFNGGTVKVITTGTTYTYGNLDTKAKGIKSDGALAINGGSIMVRATGDSGSEGIESKSTLTINGGSTEVYAYDDAINSASHMYIKNGYIYTFAINNDGLDANGNLYIQGGTTVAYGTSNPECGLDANEEGGYHLIITGGTVIGIGGGTSYPNSSSTQPSIVYGGSVSSGTTIAVNDSKSNNILSLKMGRSYNGTACFLISSPSLTKGSKYTIYTGATATGTDWHGMITGATISSEGTSAATISSLSSPYSSAGSSSGGMGGGGGQPGW
jgi:hypothetical protein